MKLADKEDFNPGEDGADISLVSQRDFSVRRKAAAGTINVGPAAQITSLADRAIWIGGIHQPILALPGIALESAQGSG